MREILTTYELIRALSQVHLGDSARALVERSRARLASSGRVPKKDEAALMDIYRKNRRKIAAVEEARERALASMRAEALGVRLDRGKKCEDEQQAHHAQEGFGF